VLCSALFLINVKSVEKGSFSLTLKHANQYMGVKGFNHLSYIKKSFDNKNRFKHTLRKLPCTEFYFINLRTF
jgi:hypothetical protein